MKINREQLLEEVAELIQIPEVGQRLHHKIEELKGLYQQNLGYYQEIGLIKKDFSSKSFDGKPFQITRKGKQWEKSIDIPQQIVDYVIKSEIEPGLAKMERGIKFPGLAGKYTITLEKLDNKRITGIIHVEKNTPGSQLDVQPPAPTQKDDFKEFIFYLTTNRDLYEQIMTDFRLRWQQKPVYYFLRTLIDQFVWHFHFDKHFGELIEDVHYIRDNVKASLDLHRYK